MLGAGDVLALLRHAAVDVVLCGQRHVTYVWLVAGMVLVHSGTAATLRTRAFTEPAYNRIRPDADRISVQLRVPGAHGRSLGEYPRGWPAELSARSVRSVRSRSHRRAKHWPTTERPTTQVRLPQPDG